MIYRQLLCINSNELHVCVWSHKSTGQLDYENWEEEL